MIVTM